MKGLSGPTKAVGPDAFSSEAKINKSSSPPTIDGKKSLRSNLMQTLGGDNRRMRRQDRICRGDTSSNKVNRFGKSDGDTQEEEKNWMAC